MWRRDLDREQWPDLPVAPDQAGQADPDQVVSLRTPWYFLVAVFYFVRISWSTTQSAQKF